MFDDIPEDQWRWEYFSRKELACRGSGECRMSPDFMDLLDNLREAYGRKMIITSGYRSPEYNNLVGTTGFDGPHTQGIAVDVSVLGRDAYDLIKAALNLGFMGIGISQNGKSRFVHLDIMENEFRPRVWSY